MMGKVQMPAPERRTFVASHADMLPSILASVRPPGPRRGAGNTRPLEPARRRSPGRAVATAFVIGAAVATPGASAETAEPAAAVPLSPGLGPLAGATAEAGPRTTPMPQLRLGGLGYPYNLAALPVEIPEGWRITPSIGIELLGTDNLFLTRTGRQADFVTSITPSLLLSADTARLRATIGYAPTGRIYADHSDQNRVDQIGNGQLLAVLVPERLFLNARGSASAQSAVGGLAPGSAQPIGRNNQVQLYSFQISPYVIHRFGSTATTQIGYSFQYSEQSGNPDSLRDQRLPFFANQDYVANRGYAVLRTGEDFGRLALQTTVDGTSFSGSGVYAGAYRFISAVEVRYAVLPSVAVLFKGGYENLRYSGLTPRHISDAVWSVGTRLTPGPESIIILRYGHHEGFDSFSLDASLALGVRTQLFASYREWLNTTIGTVQDLLSTTTLDALGNPMDSQTGAPVLYANTFFPVQSGLFRNKGGSVSLRQTWPRDTITLSLHYLDQIPISAAPGTQVFPQTSIIGSLSWAHELTQQTTAVGTVQYGHTSSSALPESDLVSVTGAVLHRFTDRLIGNLQISWVQRTSDLAANEYSQVIILAGLRQSF